MKIISLQLLIIMKLIYIISACDSYNGQHLLNFELPRILLHNCFHVQNVGLHLIEENGRVNDDFTISTFNNIQLLLKYENSLNEYIEKIGVKLCMKQWNDEECLNRSKVCSVGLLKYLKKNPTFLPYTVEKEYFNFLDISCSNDESIGKISSLEDIQYFEGCQHVIYSINKDNLYFWQLFKTKSTK
ncbi:uncharacterized protein LOC126894488 isoform X2 [Daktulosphaira vitifoliae]|nr:uncharacterized protein LOC126894488 isoform X2 [Daktulosphaira vitifoliae]